MNEVRQEQFNPKVYINKLPRNKFYPYTMVNNKNIAKNKNLSCDEAGFLLKIFSLDEEDPVTVTNLLKICSESRQVIQRKLDNLESIGYVKSKTLVQKKGCVKEYQYEINEVPTTLSISTIGNVVNMDQTLANKNSQRTVNTRSIYLLTEDIFVGKKNNNVDKNSLGIFPTDERTKELKSNLYSWNMSNKTLNQFLQEFGLDNVYEACKFTELRSTKKEIKNFAGYVKKILKNKTQQNQQHSQPVQPVNTPEPDIIPLEDLEATKARFQQVLDNWFTGQNVDNWTNKTLGYRINQIIDSALYENDIEVLKNVYQKILLTQAICDLEKDLNLNLSDIEKLKGVL